MRLALEWGRILYEIDVAEVPTAFEDMLLTKDWTARLRTS